MPRFASVPSRDCGGCVPRSPRPCRVFDYYEHVYRLADEAQYAGERNTRPGRSFKDWRTYRMSDHLPMWIEFGIDDGDAYLQSLG